MGCMECARRRLLVEAFQYDGDLMDENANWYVPDWAIKAFNDGILYFKKWSRHPAELFIRTPEGDMHVAVGDYIIKNNLYAYKSSGFKTHVICDDET